MRAAIRAQARRAVAAAASLTGKRFGLLVASSLVATSAIVASAMTGGGESGALAALLGRGIGGAPAASTVPAPAEPAGTGRSSGGSADPASAAPSPAPGPAPAPALEPAPEPASAPTAAEPGPEAGRIKHVFVISLTSPGYEGSLGVESQMPYLSGTLRPQGTLLGGYTLLDGSAAANGIAAIGGQPPNAATQAGCASYDAVSPVTENSGGVLDGSGCVYPVSTLTLADQLGLGHFTWHAYAQGMSDASGAPANCVHPEEGGPSAATAPGGYAASQNPFVYFHSLLDLGDCTANDVPLEQLDKDLASAKRTPSYSYLAPTPCESGAAGQCPAGVPEGPAAADAFLSTWVPKILESPAYKADGVLVVAFSALDPTAPGAGTPDALRTGALLLSPFLAPGSTDGAAYDPYSLLRSVEDLFGLTPLARAGGKGTKSFAPALLAENGGD
ncbi:MAG TPA: alkaline phosphatase family protein [Solirubrobacterales bacterium]